MAGAEEVVSRIEARSSLVNTLRGLTDSGIETAQGTFAGDQVLVAARPSAFRLEALGLFGGPLFLLAYDGFELTAFSLEKHTYWRGPYPPPAAAIGFPLPEIEPERLVDLVCACPRLIAPGERVVTESESAEGIALHLASTVSGARQDLVVDPELGVLLWLVETGGMGEPMLEVRYEDWAEVIPEGGEGPPILFPRRMSLAFSVTGTHLTLRFKEVSLNPPLDPRIFRLPVPKGATVVDLDG